MMHGPPEAEGAKTQINHLFDKIPVDARANPETCKHIADLVHYVRPDRHWVICPTCGKELREEPLPSILLHE